MKGSNAPNSPGNFGVQGVPASTNNPPGLYEPYEFQDAQGNFWIFGGINSASFLMYGDVWKFDPLSLTWTWMKGTGTTNAQAVYGTQGVPAPTNRPGARFRGFSWSDNNGNFWIFGGYGYDANGNLGRLSDLWKYDIATNEWTWMKGPNTINTPGSYGTLQTPSMANNPPPRDECASAWVSNTGELWMFGGEGPGGFFSDMWKYTPSTNMWTWMSGPNTTNNSANHGTLQVPSPANTPGGRSAYARWKDAAGNFWMFGGIWSGNVCNDVWRYNPNTNIWTWMGGTSLFNNPGNYGQNCLVNGFYPSGRTETRCAWKDACDRFWIMGGNNNGLLNQGVSDMWFFDPAINDFTNPAGNAAVNQPGNFGTIQVPSPTNYPPSNCGSAGFTDSQGNFWLFGGLLNPAGDVSNAMWKYTPPNPCPTYVFNMQSSPSSGCINLNVNFSVTPTGNTFTYSWNFGDPASGNNISNAPAPSHVYANAGTYYVSCIVVNTSPCNPISDTLYDTITVAPIPDPALGNDTTICGPVNFILAPSITGSNYLWNTGDTLQSIIVTSPGTYAVSVTVNGCPGTDSIIVTNYLKLDLGADTAFCIGDTVLLDAGVWDSYLWSDGTSGQTISAISSGTYWVEVFQSPCTFRDTIQIVVNPLPVVNLGQDTFICPGQNYIADAGNPGATYSWNTGDTTQQLSISESGYYNVVVTQLNCSSTDDINLTVYPDLELGNSVPFCNTEYVTLSAGPPGFMYTWSTGDTSNTIKVYFAGDYWVEVNDGRCLLQDTIQVTGAPGLGLLYVPNAFTPNGKGVIENEKFKVYGDGITTFNIQIFNRWGELLYESDDIYAGWDGTTGGKKAPEGVYVYRIIYRTECSGEQEIEKYGHFSLIR
ncbi:MAG: hypothetical protein Fur0041_21690 [Bacteroidia bacterium]